MSLHISSPLPKDIKSILETIGYSGKTPWEMMGITDEDFELAKELGLLEDEKDICEFDEMIEFEEDFLDTGLDWLDELNLANDQRYRHVEVIETTKKYKGIDVRLIIKQNSYGIGTIDGEPSVSIPQSLLKHISVGEISKMDLQYKPYNSCQWKCIFIHKKVDPVIVGEMEDCTNRYIKVHIPKYDIGEMIGSRGKYLKSVLRNAIYNEPELKELWNDKENEVNYEPKLNIYKNTNENYTEIDVWMPKRTLKNLDTSKWNVLNKFVKKIYC